MTTVPRLVVAAPASGHGKSALAGGLLAAYAARGLRVSAHKVGPDHGDAALLAAPTGRPPRNLDAWMTGERRVVPLFTHGSAGADLAVVEGTMGLFDGVAGHGDLASTAQVSRQLRAPVLLVVDVAAQGRSVAALVHGFRSYQPDVWLGGVVLHRVASAGHAAVLTAALADIGVPVFGTLRSSAGGTRPPADRVAESVDLDRVLGLARSAPSLPVEPWSPADALDTVDPESLAGSPVAVDGPPPRIAVASGAAFPHTYTELTELLTAAGAEVVPVDPMTDEQLPSGTTGLYLGVAALGPTVPDLSANEPFRAAVAAFAAAGGPVVAEDGGLVYLCRSYADSPLAGVVDATAADGRHAIGYRAAEMLADGLLAEAGEPVAGYERHRVECTPAGGTPALWRLGARVEGFGGPLRHATFLRVHWAGHPGMALRFVAAAAAHPVRSSTTAA